ncbi:MAG: diacylglycerol kinase family protein [Bacteroidetes bacterium]|nr:MAG: diacylglycerol kinase family protein [Bacteroidota bacterium]
MWKKRFNSFKYALTGIALLFRNEVNAQIHLFCAVGVVLAGFFFSVSPTEWALLIFAITLVVSAEAFNTAIEYLTNLVSPEYHPLAGKVKDLAAGAVLLCAIGAIFIGAIVFIPKLALLFQ